MSLRMWLWLVRTPWLSVNPVDWGGLVEQENGEEPGDFVEPAKEAEPESRTEPAKEVKPGNYQLGS